MNTTYSLTRKRLDPSDTGLTRGKFSPSELPSNDDGSLHRREQVETVYLVAQELKALFTSSDNANTMANYDFDKRKGFVQLSDAEFNRYVPESEFPEYYQNSTPEGDYKVRMGRNFVNFQGRVSGTMSPSGDIFAHSDNVHLIVDGETGVITYLDGGTGFRKELTKVTPRSDGSMSFQISSVSPSLTHDTTVEYWDKDGEDCTIRVIKRRAPKELKIDTGQYELAQ